jgi:hypothetical protein
MDRLFTMKQVAEILSREEGESFDYADASAIVRFLKIPVRPHPQNGRARCVDARGLETIRRRRREALQAAS